MKKNLVKTHFGKIIEYLILLAIMTTILFFLDGRQLRLSSMRYVLYVIGLFIGIDVLAYLFKKDKKQKAKTKENQTKDTK